MAVVDCTINQIHYPPEIGGDVRYMDIVYSNVVPGTGIGTLLLDIQHPTQGATWLALAVILFQVKVSGKVVSLTYDDQTTIITKVVIPALPDG